MLKIKWLKNKNNQTEIAPEEKHLSMEQAIDYVQNEIVKLSDDKDVIFKDAEAGVPGAKERALIEIECILAQGFVFVEDLTMKAAAEQIYRKSWGLDVIEDLYRDPTVDEIRINDHETIYVSRKGKNERVPLKFGSPDEAKRVIDRLYAHDVGVSLTETTPVVESIRLDGSRLTIIGSPVTETTVAVIRKQDTFEMTLENLSNAGTLDELVFMLLSLLVRGRSNILVVGGFGSGKTHLERWLIKEMSSHLRIVSLEPDREIRIRKHYPDRDVVELEGHNELEGATLKELLRTIFRLSPDVIIFPEFRGTDEAIEAIKACRTLRGCMATAHFMSAEETIEGTAMFLLEEGLTLPFELAKVRVARAFNIVIEMFSDTDRGIKKLVKVTETVVRDNMVTFNPLLEWFPYTDDYLGPGEWRLLNKPSEELLKQMSRYINAVKEVESIWSGRLF